MSKLSVISQRENVLSAIGALSRTSSSNLSTESVVKLFYPIIQQEVHEGLICHMLQQMTSWCARLMNVDQTLTEFFKVKIYFASLKDNRWTRFLFIRKD